MCGHANSVYAPVKLLEEKKTTNGMMSNFARDAAARIPSLAFVKSVDCVDDVEFGDVKIILEYHYSVCKEGQLFICVKIDDSVSSWSVQ